MKIKGSGQGIDTSASEDESLKAIEDEVRKAYEAEASKAESKDDSSGEESDEDGSDSGASESGNAETSTSDAGGDVQSGDIETDDKPIAKINSADTKEGKEPEKAAETEGPKKRGRPKKESAPEETEKIAPPNDWTAEAKEWFNVQPSAAKKEWARISQDFQSFRQKEVTKIREAHSELEKEKASVSSIVQIVDRFIPLWGAKGVTPEQAITQLCTFDLACRKDRYKAIESLAKNLKVEIEIKGRPSNGQTSQPAPQNIDSREVVERVKNDLKAETAQAQLNAEIQRMSGEIDSALTALQSETSQEGKFIYPDLHREDFQRELQSLAEGIARANPKLPWRDVLLRAYRANEGRVLPRSNPVTAKLNGNASKVAASKLAASSISGSAAEISQDELDVIPGESVEDTVRRAFALNSSR